MQNLRAASAYAYLLHGLAAHAIRLITFTHDGRGLANRNRNMLLTLIAIAAAMRFVHTLHLTGTIAFATCCLLGARFTGPAIAAAAMLIFASTDLIGAVMQVAGIHYKALTLVHQMAAIAVITHRLRETLPGRK